MLFKELKSVINRSSGRHDWISISIGLGNDAVIQAESPILDALDDYEVDWIAPATFGDCTVTEGINSVTDEKMPCINIHLKSKEKIKKSEVEE